MEINISDIISTAALITSITALALSKKEAPCIMPYGHTNSDNHLILDFKNIGNKNIYNTTILINIFDNTLNEISESPIEDQLLFTVGSDATFNYGITLDKNLLQKEFFFRFHFNAKYSSVFPFFKNKQITENIWFSGTILSTSNKGTTIKIATSHKDKITKLKAKHGKALEEYEKNIQNKFN